MELPYLCLFVTSAEILFSLPHPSPVNAKERLVGTVALPSWSPETFGGEVIHLPAGDCFLLRVKKILSPSE